MYKNDQEFLQKRYDPIHNRTIDYKHDAWQRILAVLSGITKLHTPVKLLDVGCYDGYIASLMRERMGNTCRLYGVDAANNSLTLARQQGMTVKVCDVTKGLPYVSDFFDYVFAGEIIEHIVDTDFFMREIKRVLKPDGICILTTPNSLSLGRRLHYLIGSGIFLEVSYSIPKNAAGHVRYFTFGSMKEFMTMHEFQITRIVSDTVNFPWFKSPLLAQIIPTIGQSIIVFAQNNK